MHYEIIINPAAGSGKGRQAWQLVEAELQRQGISYQAHVSQGPGQPREICRQLLKDPSFHPSCLIVVGGDGSLHEVITALVQEKQENHLPVAYIPAGTGNDFARGYGISTKPRQALQQILDNDQAHLINVAQFDNHGQSGIFLNNFGIGFDAAIVHQTNASKMKEFLNRLHLGSFSYISKAIGVLIRQPAFPVQVTVDGQHYRFPQGFLVVASNHPYIGGGIKVAPDQQVDQEELELLVLEKHDPLTLLGSILMFATGKLAYSRFAHVFRGKSLHYQTFSPQDGQIDGEELPAQAFNLQMSCLSYPFWEKRQ